MNNAAKIKARGVGRAILKIGAAAATTAKSVAALGAAFLAAWDRD